MVDSDSIKRASDLVNSVLFARGYFPNTTDDASPIQDKLLFHTINSSELETPEQVHSNDKLVLNTIYALLQELDHTKTEKQYLVDQLADKTEIIKHYEASNKEHQTQTDHLKRDIIHRSNEITVLKQSVKSLKSEKITQERQLVAERNINTAMRSKFDIEMKKKSITIEKLQDKLLSKRHKFQSIIERNNHSFVESHANNDETKKIALDDEMEKMMVSLSDLITSLTTQNNEGVHLLNYIVTYLAVLMDHMMRRLETDAVGLPPTPKFFYDNVALDRHSGEVTERISQVVEMEKLRPGVLDSLERLYELTTSDLAMRTSTDDGKVVALQREVVVLKKNLEAAMEMNDKWSRKFQQTR